MDLSSNSLPGDIPDIYPAKLPSSIWRQIGVVERMEDRLRVDVRAHQSGGVQFVALGGAEPYTHEEVLSIGGGDWHDGVNILASRYLNADPAHFRNIGTRLVSIEITPPTIE